MKRGSFVWDFHKSDADPWPSLLHGHDYDKGLKLDAITGQVYDVVTKTCCKVLKEKDLKAIQDALRKSKDFHNLVVDELIDIPKKAEEASIKQAEEARVIRR